MFHHYPQTQRSEITNHLAEFEKLGYTLVESVIPQEELRSIERCCSQLDLSRAGARDLLALDWCANIARVLREHPTIHAMLQNSLTAIQCTLFVKNDKRNWLVPLHRDLGIPVKNRVESPNWSGWSVKQGTLHAQPPESVLKGLVAVRLHLEDTGVDNGALQVVPGSHLLAEDKGKRIFCTAPKGGALVMRPLLLHASSKVRNGTRKVLHFVYGPSQLPDGAEWANPV
ncbi:MULTISPECIES: phytanoyl-CoA dioxygenase family protein [unclassified Microbulbifer]|uniref:phytanoyl-CoA dioxygenase family protein n=1 Tax=unclassified Microbulbifer TaxID=2619833 RepID=UPI0027E3EB45|nr:MULTISPECIES: phytanoyl-CoA dioxygenase family protein [unclassified Microbulbifer]